MWLQPLTTSRRSYLHALLPATYSHSVRYLISTLGPALQEASLIAPKYALQTTSGAHKPNNQIQLGTSIFGNTHLKNISFCTLQTALTSNCSKKIHKFRDNINSCIKLIVELYSVDMHPHVFFEG